MILKLVGIGLMLVILILMSIGNIVAAEKEVEETAISSEDTKRIYYVTKKGARYMKMVPKGREIVIGNLFTPVCDIRLFTVERVKLLLDCRDRYNKLGIMKGAIKVNGKIKYPNRKVMFKVFDEIGLYLPDGSYLYIE